MSDKKQPNDEKNQDQTPTTRDVANRENDPQATKDVDLTDKAAPSKPNVVRGENVNRP